MSKAPSERSIPRAPFSRDPHKLARPRSSRLLFLLLSLLFAAFCDAASAHDLEVDTLTVQLRTDSNELSGQLFLDPDLTRPGEPSEDDSARVLAFVEQHVRLRADGKEVPLSLGIRELYQKGGAVPGDSVTYRATLPARMSQLTVAIRQPLEKLAVTVTLDNTQNPTILVVGSEETPLFEAAPTGTGRKEAPATPSPLPTISGQIARYLWIGFVHIVPLGWDHILFVLALTLGTLGRRKERRYRRLLLELSAFTLAHTLTLALGALDILRVPGSVVEPLIAFSIAAMAAEHVLLGDRTAARFLLVTFFGLIHGLGFAGALHELGLGGPRFVLFLASFNVGVELGQIVVVAGAALVLHLIGRSSSSERILKWASWSIVVTGVSVGVLRIIETTGESARSDATGDPEPVSVRSSLTAAEPKARPSLPE